MMDTGANLEKQLRLATLLVENIDSSSINAERGYQLAKLVLEVHDWALEKLQEVPRAQEKPEPTPREVIDGLRQMWPELKQRLKSVDEFTETFVPTLSRRLGWVQKEIDEILKILSS